MKNGYKGAESSELIEKYETSNDKIIIRFLDGSSFEIPLTEENEKNLLNKMLEQAQLRNNSTALGEAKKRRQKALFWVISQVVCNIINAGRFCMTDSKGERIFCGILGGLSGLIIVIDGFSYKINNDEIKELKKYDIFLSIRERLECTSNPNLFNGVKSNETNLNINTLDNYSLKDMKKISANLERCEKFSKYFEDSSNDAVLAKKIGK